MLEYVNLFDKDFAKKSEDTEFCESYSAEEQVWDHATLIELRNKYNIYYDGDGIFAIKIIPRKKLNPLFALGIEDDGIISFTLDRDGNYFHQVDLSWAKNLIYLLQQACKKYLK